MDPKQCFKNVIAGVPWAYLCLQTRFRNWCTDSVHLLQIKPALPTSESLDYIASGLLGPTSGLPLPTSKSLEYIAMESLLCNLCCAIFAVQYLLRNLCHAIFARQSLLSQSLRSYLRPTFANQPIPLRKPALQT